MTKSVSIIVTTADVTTQIFRKCVESLNDNTKLEYELLVLRDERKDFGFAKANNRLIRTSECPYVVLLNDDCFVSEGWLETMLNYMKTDSRLGIVGGMMDNATVMSEGHVPFYLVLIKKEVFEKIGLLNESFRFGYEDHEFCDRAKRAGFTVGFVDTGSVHIGDASSIGLRHLPPQLKGLITYRRMKGESEAEIALTSIRYVQRYLRRHTVRRNRATARGSTHEPLGIVP